MSSPERPAALPATALLRATKRLLRPLVRMLMQSGITFPVLADLLRMLFVEVALTDLLTDEREQTDSRVNLLTGLQRREIRRQRQQESDPDAIPPIVTLSSQMIARWLGTPSYLDTDGQPLPLPRVASPDAPGISFDALVESITTDFRPRTVLVDWLDQGLVTLDADERVRLNMAAFIPRPGSAEQIFYFGRNLHDHIAAAAANIVGAGPAPFVDRCVHYDGLDPQAAAALEASARKAAQRILVEVNSVALGLVEGKTPDAGIPATLRVNFGVYVYVEDEAGRKETPA